MKLSGHILCTVILLEKLFINVAQCNRACEDMKNSLWIRRLLAENYWLIYLSCFIRGPLVCLCIVPIKIPLQSNSSSATFFLNAVFSPCSFTPFLFPYQISLQCDIHTKITDVKGNYYIDICAIICAVLCITQVRPPGKAE